MQIQTKKDAIKRNKEINQPFSMVQGACLHKLLHNRKNEYMFTHTLIPQRQMMICNGKAIIHVYKVLCFLYLIGNIGLVYYSPFPSNNNKDMN